MKIIIIMLCTFNIIISIKSFLITNNAIKEIEELKKEIEEQINKTQ